MVGSAALPGLRAVATTTPLIVTVGAGGVGVGVVSLPPQALSAAAAMAVSTSVFDKGAYFMLGVISILKCSWGAGQGARVARRHCKRGNTTTAEHWRQRHSYKHL